MTGGFVVLVQLVLQRCCELASGSQRIKHNRIEFVSIVCSNKPLLLISLLMAVFVVGTITAAIIQIIGALSGVKKEAVELYEIVHPPPTEEPLFEEPGQQRYNDEPPPKLAASTRHEPLQYATGMSVSSTPQVAWEPSQRSVQAAGESSGQQAASNVRVQAASDVRGQAAGAHVLALPVLRPLAGPVERRLSSYKVIATLRPVDPETTTLNKL